MENLSIYRLAVGYIEHFVAARDEQHAYEQGTDPERFPDMHFLPFQITKIEVPGYNITVTPIASAEPETVETAPVVKRGRKAAS